MTYQARRADLRNDYTDWITLAKLADTRPHLPADNLGSTEQVWYINGYIRLPSTKRQGNYMHRGSCLCGAIQLQINQQLSDFGYCHCQSCQKASGSAFGANAGVERSAVAITDSENSLTEYQSSPGKLRAFCCRCGSPIYAFHSQSPNLLRIRLGILDTPFNKSCRAHTFVAEKASWETVEGDFPQFDAWADSEVLVQLGSKQPL